MKQHLKEKLIVKAAMGTGKELTFLLPQQPVFFLWELVADLRALEEDWGC